MHLSDFQALTQQQPFRYVGEVVSIREDKNELCKVTCLLLRYD